MVKRVFIGIFLFLLLSAGGISTAPAQSLERQPDANLIKSGACLVFHNEDGKFLVCQDMEQIPAAEQVNTSDCQEDEGSTECDGDSERAM